MQKKIDDKYVGEEFQFIWKEKNRKQEKIHNSYIYKQVHLIGSFGSGRQHTTIAQGNENNGQNLWTNKDVHATNPFQGKVNNYKMNNRFS